MTKKARDLKPGDVVDRKHAISGEVIRVHRSGRVVDVLMDSHRWDALCEDAEVEIKPRTIKASEVKTGMKVRFHFTHGSRALEVYQIGTRADGHILMAGSAVENVMENQWLLLEPDQEVEVVE